MLGMPAAHKVGGHFYLIAQMSRLRKIRLLLTGASQVKTGGGATRFFG